MHKIELNLTPENNQAIQALAGYFNKNFDYIEQQLEVEISGQNFNIMIYAENKSKGEIAKQVIEHLYKKLFTNSKKIKQLDPQDLEQLIIQIQQEYQGQKLESYDLKTQHNNIASNLVKGKIKFRNQAQQQYIKAISSNSVVFGVGPAGTGKTFLAVAYAIDALIAGRIDRIFVTRPLVEAGEQIGFLPGDIKNKLDPYLKPIFDAFADIIGQEKTTSILEKGIVEISPLAYMRGRTFNNSVVILDEAQNASPSQIKLILTRLGHNCKVIINGDLSQVDIKGRSGLMDALTIFAEMPQDIAIFKFAAADIVRSRIAKLIVDTYEKVEALEAATKQNKPSPKKRISVKDLINHIQELEE